MRVRRGSFAPVYALAGICEGRSAGAPRVAFLVSALSKIGNTVPYISTTEAAWAEPAIARAAARRDFEGFILIFLSRIVYFAGSFTSANLSNSTFQYSLPRFSTRRMYTVCT